MFFDEVDAIGGARFDDGQGGDNEVQRTMLEIVNQLDGFDSRGNIKVLPRPTGSQDHPFPRDICVRPQCVKAPLNTQPTGRSLYGRCRAGCVDKTCAQSRRTQPSCG